MPSLAISGHDLPPLIVDAAHYDSFEALARRVQPQLPQLAGLLLSELSRAELREAADIPDDVVVPGARVTYQDEGSGAIRSLVLVWPAQADAATMRISILSPIGVALLGLRSGQRMRWQLDDGETRMLSVLHVSRTAMAN